MNRPTFRLLAALVIVASGAAPGSAPAAEAPDYLERIESAEEFDAVSVSETAEGRVRRTTRFLLPARAGDPALVGPLFQNVARHRFHHEFLASVFPDRFPGLTFEEYEAMVARRGERDYFAGTVSLFEVDGESFFGFAVFTDPLDEVELLTAAETASIFATIGDVFAPRPLVYAPLTFAAQRAAEGWLQPSFPVYTGGVTESDYVAYTSAIGYGRVRVLSPDAFERAMREASLSWQDLLVLARAPSDIEGVVAGVITAEPQLGELSHLAIRTARRGTPNAFLRDATAQFAALEGRLVRLEVRRDALVYAEASEEEAERFWRESRPRLSGEPELDEEYAELDRLSEMDLTDSAAAIARFGGKAVNLARLQQVVFDDVAMAAYREVGFGIPVRHYLEFMRSNTLDTAGGPASYEAFLHELLADGTFQSDARARREALEAFRDHAREHGVVPRALLLRLAARIREVFGSSSTPVRFRSSSNVEDQLEFNGAGLYESTTACADDTFDGNERGPSICNPTEVDERTIERALLKVWTSLWTFRAFEEREWYQVPQERTAMAILVTRTFLDEDANGVAFTGNPSAPHDPRFLVTSQRGEASVVTPAPGESPEKVGLELDGAGAVIAIERLRASSLVAPGEHVLDDDMLRELGGVLWRIGRDMPVDLDEHTREEVLFDIEFKLTAAGDLAIKQARPFLVVVPPFEAPAVELVVPDAASVCGVFGESRSLAEELALKSRVELVAGTHSLPGDAAAFELDLVESLVFGPDAAPARALSRGRVASTIAVGGTGAATYSVVFTQRFELAGGESFTLELRLETAAESPGAPPPPVVLDEAYLARRLVMSGAPDGDTRRLVRYRSCSFDAAPLWDVRATLDDGATLRYLERSHVPVAGTEPVLIEAAQLEFGGDERRIEDYFELVYAAERHNVHPRYLAVLAPAARLAGIGDVAAVELVAPQEDRGAPATARYLDGALGELAAPRVVSYWRGPFGEEPPRGFRRGDANVDGRVNLADALAVLGRLFQGAAPLACEDAADVEDDGVVEITDAVLILGYLFQSLDPPASPGPTACGPDQADDRLGECRYDACALGR